MKIMIGSDHHGIDIRQAINRLVSSLGCEVTEVGPAPENPAPVDYPDVAEQVAEAVSKKTVDRGILICGTGIGMSIVANKFSGVRAAPVADVFSAEISRRHNDLNVLCLSAEMLSAKMIEEIVQAWLKTDFSTNARHSRRLGRIAKIELDQIESRS